VVKHAHWTWLGIGLRTAALAVALGTATAAAAQDGSSNNGALVLKKFGSFFVGGRDMAVPYRSGNFISSTYEQPDVVKVDQMYVQYMIPAQQKHKIAVVFSHGAWHTGKTWEETPDGREGWVNYFVRQGFSTYWVDKPWRARSGFNAHTINAVARGDASRLPTIYLTGHAGWAAFRIGPAYPAANPGVQFPLEAADQYFAQLVPDFSVELRGSPNAQSYPMLNEDMGILFAKVRPAVYVGHSQGGAELPGIVSAHPELFVGAVSVEGGCPPVADAALYQSHRIPFAIMTGDYTNPPAACQAFIDALNAMGGSGTNLWLPALGIHGNDHMMMLDKNSDQVAQVLVDWIEQHVEGRHK